MMIMTMICMVNADTDSYSDVDADTDIDSYSDIDAVSMLVLRP